MAAWLALTGPAAGVARAAGPVNSAPPTIGGVSQEGHVLNATAGQWTGTGTLTYGYHWQRCDTSGANCLDISGQTTPSYTLTRDDVDRFVTVAVTATDQNSVASTPAPAVPVGLIRPPFPVNTAAPVITGTARDGDPLTVVDNGTWTHEGALTFMYEWTVCYLSGARAGNCNEPPGETGGSLVLSAADVGDNVRVQVTAVDHVGQAVSYINDSDVDEASSNAIGPIAAPPPPLNTVAPTTSGPLGEGQTLTIANPGAWASPDLLKYSYQWVRCNSSGGQCTTTIKGQDTKSYKLTAADAGRYVSVIVTARDQEGQVGSALAVPRGLVTGTVRAGTPGGRRTPAATNRPVIGLVQRCLTRAVTRRRTRATCRLVALAAGSRIVQVTVSRGHRRYLGGRATVHGKSAVLHLHWRRLPRGRYVVTVTTTTTSGRAPFVVRRTVTLP